MELISDARLTVAARVHRDSKFRGALLAEAVNACLAGDMRTGKAVLRDLVNATVGFKGLAAEVRTPSKSLRDMLVPRGNPSAKNFFDIVKALQKKTCAQLQVTTESSRKAD